jgi:hypothetical protein
MTIGDSERVAPPKGGFGRHVLWELFLALFSSGTVAVKTKKSEYATVVINNKLHVIMVLFKNALHCTLITGIFRVVFFVMTLYLLHP